MTAPTDKAEGVDLALRSQGTSLAKELARPDTTNEEAAQRINNIVRGAVGHDRLDISREAARRWAKYYSDAEAAA